LQKDPQPGVVVWVQFHDGDESSETTTDKPESTAPTRGVIASLLVFSFAVFFLEFLMEI